MRYSAGTTNVATAGTRVQVSNTPDRVLWIRFTARDGNVGGVYVGASGVSSSVGRELHPPLTANASALASTTEYDFGCYTGKFGPGSVPFSTFWADADTNANKVDWEVILAD